jgi:glycosyltransferase involved in cell wall biosynthesis
MYRRIRKFVRRLIAHRANALLTNNIDGKSYLVQELGVDEDKIISRPYLTSDMSQYININEYSGSDKKTRDNSKPVRYIYAGRLIKSKGINHALEAFHYVMQKHPGKFLFDIVGDGPDRTLLDKQVQQLGLQDHVHFHGQQPYLSLAALYQEADVFLFPTLVDYRSLVGFEAMSVGLPILASIHDGGSIETVKEGENGYTFDPLDHRRLAEILSRFIERPELIEAFSAKSKVMSESYTLPRAVDSAVMAIDLALAGSRG